MGESNFKAVKRYNYLIGNNSAGGWLSAKDQLELIEEEFTELKRGIVTNDLTETRDGIADMLVTIYGLAHRLNIDADADFQIVHESNMSKFCKDAEELDATIKHYESIGLVVTHYGYFPEVSVMSAKSQKDCNGKLYPIGKQLKCIHWKEPKFK